MFRSRHYDRLANPHPKYLEEPEERGLSERLIDASLKIGVAVLAYRQLLQSGVVEDVGRKAHAAIRATKSYASSRRPGTFDLDELVRLYGQEIQRGAESTLEAGSTLLDHLVLQRKRLLEDVLPSQGITSGLDRYEELVDEEIIRRLTMRLQLATASVA